MEISKRDFVKGIALGGLAIGSGILPARVLAAPEAGITGQRMPPLQAEFWIDGEGNKTGFSMAELENKWVFLKCFQNWCPGCHKHGFPTLKKVYDNFGNDDRVAIIGIQTVFEGHFINTGSALRELQLRYDVPIKMGHDPGDETSGNRSKNMAAYRTGGTPWLIVANPQGIVVFNNFHMNADKFVAIMHKELDKMKGKPA